MTPGDIKDRYYYDLHPITGRARLLDRERSQEMAYGMSTETAERICKALNADKKLNTTRYGRIDARAS